MERNDAWQNCHDLDCNCSECNKSWRKLEKMENQDMKNSETGIDDEYERQLDFDHDLDGW